MIQTSFLQSISSLAINRSDPDCTSAKMLQGEAGAEAFAADKKVDIVTLSAYNK